MKFGFIAKVTTALAILICIFAVIKAQTNRVHLITDLPVIKKQPLPSQNVIPAFSAMTNVVKKKKAFFKFIQPEIARANRNIAFDRQFVLDLKSRIENIEKPPLRYYVLLKDYKVPSTDFNQHSVNELLERLDTIPQSLIMVQAANESGWGTSRFARLGLNFFGQWCFKKGCGLVPNERNTDADHEVKVFKSVYESINSYLRNLNTHPAYQHLRDVRSQLRKRNEPVTAEKLAQGLTSYSERREDYVLDILTMLKQNKAYL